MGTKFKSLAVAVTFSIVTGCSSEKYDSWSECMSDEYKESRNWQAARLYCDANYQMTPEEREVRRDIYCSSPFNEDEKICGGSGVLDAAAGAEATVEDAAGDEDSAQVPEAGSSNPSPPQVGEIVDGYRFNGGDPADPSNWEVVGN